MAGRDSGGGRTRRGPSPGSSKGGGGGKKGGGGAGEGSADRLNKLLAHAGVASRRGAEELITQGRVTVNGAKVTEVGAKVAWKVDTVCVDGKQVELRPPVGHEVQWLAVHKPKGVLASTTGDARGRKHLGQVVGQLAQDKRLVPVGKLDRETTGLVLLTNDFEASHLLSQPSFGLVKEYKVVVQNGMPKLATLEALAAGGMAVDDDEDDDDERGRGGRSSRRPPGGARRQRRSLPMDVEVLDYFADRKETVLRVRGGAQATGRRRR